MQDLKGTFDELFDYVRGIWIKKRYVMITSWLIIPIGLLYVAAMPDVYQSQARVFVDTRSLLQPVLRGLAFETNPQQEIAMMVQTLLSRDNVEKIARGADLDITATTDAEYSALIDRLTNNIKLISTGRENLYTISYTHENAVVARTVVQETLDLFVEGALGESRADSNTATRFLDEQIVDYENRLTQAEQQLADFQRKYAELLPVAGSFYQNLQGLRNQKDQTQLQIRELEQQRATFLEQLEARQAAAQNGDVQSGSDLAITTRYDDRIRALESKLDDLRLRFTDQHPDVIETTKILDNLLQVREEEIQQYLASQQTSGSGTGELSQLGMTIRSEISRIEGEIASLRVREQDFDDKIEELRAKIDLVPQIEAEQTALNRDYGILKQKYLELLSRKEAAELSQRADVSSEDFQFRIIEPPMAPNKPAGPNRLIFYTLVVLVGFLAGAGIAFFISQLTPLLIRGTQLANETGYPVLGAVSHIDVRSLKRTARVRLLVFLCSSGVLLCFYGVLMAAEIMDIDLLGRFI
ncbi:Wzz/FepE/Etk N-terminal domain-containing protein [Alteromonas sp. ASW11-36]|uniref:Wzz/FepE/Etk N-terminal domain-containing protein n=1 Tax=Alteromonas arenosi TaxID=3055817 RepID=A0ABT7STW8_9ALTE|nr:XrtA system polysaccharide chain length determinant [Alteromonas sp. ASW11-36]MDM7859620.1 Wzz/FepE/Etk N-terminal domain-containing protein [Alteromonas sp. ASW11-36]